MTVDRRRFLTGALRGGALTGLALAGCKPSARPAPAGPAPAAPADVAPAADGRDGPAAPPRPQRLLILGGTGFLGPHLVDAARARGHTVTLFNRGKTKPHLFPDVEKLRGDRDGDLKALEGRAWDAVLDTSGYVPRLVRASAELLAPNIQQYVFISSISVYARLDQVGADERAAVEPLADPASEDVRKDYGALKAACERAAEAALPGRVTNVRPGLIIGPLDPTGRFTHWVTRLTEGGEVLAPGDGATPVQWIDGRDLAAWLVRAVEDRALGVFNALGPRELTTMRQALERCNAALGGRATLTWVPASFLAAQKVSGWSDLPMWLPPEGEFAGFGTLSNARAVAAGLQFRPIAATAADTLAWLGELPADAPAKVRSSGLSREREAAVLAAFRAR
ncbi:MAG: NAD-dependent epimerase/dehydratase family protein [Kofleriaceae bacterium]